MAVAAGVIADVDLASAWWGASAYLRGHQTYTHGLLTSVVIAALFAAAYRFLADDDLRRRFAPTNAFAMALAACGLHLLMEVFGWEGVALFWPFSTRRFAMDLVVNSDPGLLAILLVALLFPELLHLVGTEIGARDEKPRGRIGALVGFAMIVMYLGLRADFHAEVMALLESRTFHGESARRAAAFPEALSPVSWHSVVETERALHELTVMVGPLEAFDPESADTFFKPEPSAALETAQKTRAAQDFLKVAQFPHATVEHTAAGSRVEIRDLRYAAVGETGREILAVVALDAANHVITEELAWAREAVQE